MYNSCVYQLHLNVIYNNHGNQTTDKHKYIVYLSALSVAWHLICLHYQKMLIYIAQFIHIQSHHHHHNPHTLSQTKRETNFRVHTTRTFFKDYPQIKLLQYNKTEKNFRGYQLGRLPTWPPPCQTMNSSAYLAAAGLTHLNQIRNRRHQHQHNDPKKRCY